MCYRITMCATVCFAFSSLVAMDSHEGRPAAVVLYTSHSAPIPIQPVSTVPMCKWDDQWHALAPGRSPSDTLHPAECPGHLLKKVLAKHGAPAWGHRRQLSLSGGDEPRQVLMDRQVLVTGVESSEDAPSGETSADEQSSASSGAESNPILSVSPGDKKLQSLLKAEEDESRRGDLPCRLSHSQASMNLRALLK